MSNKISCPYPDLQAHKCFWKAPLSHFVFIDLLCATWPTVHLLTYFLIPHSPPGMCPCHFGCLSLWFNTGNTLWISLGLWMGRNNGICHDNEGRRGGGELVNFHLSINYTSFNVWIRYFVWNFKGNLWNSTQNILPVHWKGLSWFSIENLRALRFTS